MIYIHCPLAYQIYLERVPFFTLAIFQQTQIYTIITTCPLAFTRGRTQGEAKGNEYTFTQIAMITLSFIGSVNMAAQKVTNLQA
jgi:hypothetical protein